jgi:hypothetical protein
MRFPRFRQLAMVNWFFFLKSGSRKPGLLGNFPNAALANVSKLVKFGKSEPSPFSEKTLEYFKFRVAPIAPVGENGLAFK